MFSQLEVSQACPPEDVIFAVAKLHLSCQTATPLRFHVIYFPRYERTQLLQYTGALIALCEPGREDF